MSYFSLQKRDPEPEPEPDPDETEEEAPEAEDDESSKEERPAGKTHGPFLTGILGPGQWLAARFSPGAALGVHIVAVWAVAFYGGWIAAGIVLAWLLAVLAFVPREHLERLANKIEKRGTSEDQEVGEDPPTDPFVSILWQLIGNAPGVHLKTVAKYLQKAAPEQPVDRPAVRAKLGALGIPIRGSVRDAVGRVNEGVHGDDLQAWEETLPPTATGTPSEPRSGPGSDAVTSDVGTDATSVAMPRSPFRRLLSRGGA